MLRPLAPGRCRCAVVGCGRTFKCEVGGETICGKHWRMAPLTWRRRYTRLMKIWRREGEGTTRRGYRAEKLLGELWNRIKRRATEVAMGISA